MLQCYSIQLHNVIKIKATTFNTFKVGVLQVALVTLGRHIGLLNNWYCQPEQTEVSYTHIIF